jgi:hypothetical protein
MAARVYANTPVYGWLVDKISQSVLFVPRHEESPLQAHMNTNTVHKGACLLPFDNLEFISVRVDHTNVRNYHFAFVLKNF